MKQDVLSITIAFIVATLIVTLAVMLITSYAISFVGYVVLGVLFVGSFEVYVSISGE